MLVRVVIDVPRDLGPIVLQFKPHQEQINMALEVNVGDQADVT